MAIRRIARMGNPILHRIAAPIEDPTAPEIVRLAEDMKDTLIDIGGSGIAAPQVFESVRVVVYRLKKALKAEAEEILDPWIVMVNPELTPLAEATELRWEHCLSIPGLHGKVPRMLRIQIRYWTPDGEEVSHEAEGAHAIMLQHECDHLDGILYPMRMTDLSKLEFNAEPGQLAQDFADGVELSPRMRRLVEAWPGRSQWMG